MLMSNEKRIASFTLNSAVPDFPPRSPQQKRNIVFAHAQDPACLLMVPIKNGEPNK